MRSLHTLSRCLVFALFSTVLALQVRAAHAEDRNCPARIFIQAFDVRVDTTDEEKAQSAAEKAARDAEMKEKIKTAMVNRLTELAKQVGDHAKGEGRAPSTANMPEAVKDAIEDGELGADEIEELAESLSDEEMERIERESLQPDGQKDVEYEEFLGFNLEERLKAAMMAELSRVRILTQTHLAGTIRAEGNSQRTARENDEPDSDGGDASEEMQDDIALMHGSDFLVDGNVRQFQSKYVLNGSVLNQRDASKIAGYVGAADSPSQLGALVDAMGKKFGLALVDRFYCIEAEPETIDLGEEVTKIEGRIKDLKNRPVDGARVFFSCKDDSRGSLDPEEAPAKGGTARSAYKRIKPLKNTVSMRVQGKPEGGGGIWTYATLQALPPGWILTFTGQGQAQFAMAEEGTFAQIMYQSIFKEARAEFLVDEEENIIGSGHVLQDFPNSGSVSGEDFQLVQRSTRSEVRSDLQVGGKIEGGVAKLILVMQPSGGGVTTAFDDSEGRHEDITQEIEPWEFRVDIPLQDGETKVEEKDLLNYPIVGMNQHYRLEFKLEADKKS